MRNPTYKKADLKAHVHLQMKKNKKGGEQHICDVTLIPTGIINYTIGYIKKKSINQKKSTLKGDIICLCLVLDCLASSEHLTTISYIRAIVYSKRPRHKS